MNRRPSSARVLLLAATLALGGCSDPDPEPLTLERRIDGALTQGLQWLLEQQEDDGTWRSKTYGGLKDGFSLTPLVVKTLCHADRPELRAAARRGADWLASHVGKDGTLEIAEGALGYPVYTAALTVMALTRIGAPELIPARDAWLKRLRRHQLTEHLGWPSGHWVYGGWGYSRVPLRIEAFESPRLASFDADLSSTLFAVGALSMAGAPEDDPALTKARGFIVRCQNLPHASRAPDPTFDDGGFHFTPRIELQNKAGIAGVDQNQDPRYRSYGSLTADGLRALLRTGFPLDSPRVRAARRWLETHFDAEHNPGEFDPAREPERNASYYYWCWSAAHAFRILGATGFDDAAGKRVGWATKVATALLARRGADGTWRNPATFVKEDDPIVGTSLALGGLALARAMME